MTFSIVRMTDYSFQLEDEKGTTFPADFLCRPAAETVCIALNRLESSQREPIRIVLDKPKLSPGRTYAESKKRVTLTLDGYGKPKDKQLVIAVRDEQPAPPAKPRTRITL